MIHEALFRVLALLVPIHEDKMAAAQNEKLFAAQHSEIDRITAEIKHVQETSNDALRLVRLRRALQFRAADADKYGEAALAAKLALAARQKMYGAAVLAETRVIGRKVDELISSIRTELSLATSLEQLHATSEAMHAAAVAATRELNASFGGAAEAAPR